MQSSLVVCFCLEIVIKWIFDLLGWETNGKEPGKVKGKIVKVTQLFTLVNYERQREEITQQIQSLKFSKYFQILNCFRFFFNKICCLNKSIPLLGGRLLKVKVNQQKWYNNICLNKTISLPFCCKINTTQVNYIP